jgi:D-sedoheptulose 7-phosphate isomerase
MSVLVFTNGCFDLLHPGHIDLLERARALGDRLIVGINSDDSVRAIKGTGRPLVSQEDRTAVLRGLRSVDEVMIFDEPTPARLIEQVKPDVLVKGGDWPIEQIIGADFVQRNGGRVLSLPLKPSYSTSNLIRQIQLSSKTNLSDAEDRHAGHETAEKSLRAHQQVIAELSESGMEAIRRCAQVIFESLAGKHKLLLCGNGGSAADAQHIAAEFVGRFENERRGWPAIALTTDTSTLTSVSNDYGFEHVFARQVEALATPGDALVAISTSGNSPNVIAAVMAAQKVGCKTVGLTGAGGKRLASLCDAAVLVPATRTTRIQEAHNLIGHLWCEIVDDLLGEQQTTR